MKNYIISPCGFDNSVTIRGEVGAALIDAVRKGCSLIIEDSGHGAFTIKPTVTRLAKSRVAQEILRKARRHTTFFPLHGVTVVIVPVTAHTKVGLAESARRVDEISACGRGLRLPPGGRQAVPFILTLTLSLFVGSNAGKSGFPQPPFRRFSV
jgi:hypothetical protein